MRRFVIGLLVALAATACGESAPTRPVAVKPSASPSARPTLAPPMVVVGAARAKTQGAGSAVTSLTITGKVGSQRVEISGAGKLDFVRGRGEQTMDLTLPDRGATMTMTALLDRSTIYLNIGEILEPGKEWLRLDSPEMSSFGAQNPAASLVLLDGLTSAKRVGAQTLRGEPTTRYLATVDVVAAQRRATGLRADYLEEYRGIAGGRALPVHVWVDGQGRVAKFVYRTSVGPSSGTAGRRVSRAVTIEYLGWREPVDVTYPERSVVIDGTPFLNRLSG